MPQRLKKIPEHGGVERSLLKVGAQDLVKNPLQFRAGSMPKRLHEADLNLHREIHRVRRLRKILRAKHAPSLQQRHVTGDFLGLRVQGFDVPKVAAAFADGKGGDNPILPTHLPGKGAKARRQRFGAVRLPLDEQKRKAGHVDIRSHMRNFQVLGEKPLEEDAVRENLRVFHRREPRVQQGDAHHMVAGRGQVQRQGGYLPEHLRARGKRAVQAALHHGLAQRVKLAVHGLPQGAHRIGEGIDRGFQKMAFASGGFKAHAHLLRRGGDVFDHPAAAAPQGDAKEASQQERGRADEGHQVLDGRNVFQQVFLARQRQIDKVPFLNPAKKVPFPLVRNLPVRRGVLICVAGQVLRVKRRIPDGRQRQPFAAEDVGPAARAGIVCAHQAVQRMQFQLDHDQPRRGKRVGDAPQQQHVPSSFILADQEIPGIALPAQREQLLIGHPAKVRVAVVVVARVGKGVGLFDDELGVVEEDEDILDHLVGELVVWQRADRLVNGIDIPVLLLKPRAVDDGVGVRVGMDVGADVSQLLNARGDDVRGFPQRVERRFLAGYQNSVHRGAVQRHDDQQRNQEDRKIGKQHPDGNAVNPFEEVFQMQNSKYRFDK